MSNARKDEAEAVRTTIVGGRPPGSGRNNVPVPRGIEVLVKKASVDAGFRELFLKQRGKAAATIQLELDPAEDAMLSVIPQEQLAQIVDQTTVPMELRSAFRGRVALVMLAALGAGLAASSPAQPTFGAQPNESNAIQPQAQPTNPPSYTGPPVAVAGALPLPDKTTTNVPSPNVEITNPPPPQRPSTVVAGLLMRVPPSPASNAPGTNTTNTIVVFGLGSTPPTNATPGEPPRTNPPSTNVISPPIRGLQPNVPVFGLRMTPPTNPPLTNATIAEATPTNPPSTNEISPAIHGLRPIDPGFFIISGIMVRPRTNPPPTHAPGTNAPDELTRTDPPSAKQQAAT
jgi:hypothetical protein